MGLPLAPTVLTACSRAVASLRPPSMACRIAAGVSEAARDAAIRLHASASARCRWLTPHRRKTFLNSTIDRSVICSGSKAHDTSAARSVARFHRRSALRARSIADVNVRKSRISRLLQPFFRRRVTAFTSGIACQPCSEARGLRLRSNSPLQNTSVISRDSGRGAAFGMRSPLGETQGASILARC